MDIRKIGLIGAGQMGNGIAHVMALAGYDVVMSDVSQQALDNAMAAIQGNMARQASRGKISDDDMRTAFVSAESRLTQARQMKREVQENLRYSILKAPFDGQITAKRTNVGDLVNPGQPALAIENAGPRASPVTAPNPLMTLLIANLFQRKPEEFVESTTGW